MNRFSREEGGGGIGVKNYISFVFNIFHYILSLLLLLIIIVIYDKSFSALELFFFELSKSYMVRAQCNVHGDGSSENYLPIFRCKDSTRAAEAVLLIVVRGGKSVCCLHSCCTHHHTIPYFRLEEINYLQQNDERGKKSREGYGSARQTDNFKLHRCCK